MRKEEEKTKAEEEKKKAKAVHKKELAKQRQRKHRAARKEQLGNQVYKAMGVMERAKTRETNRIAFRRNHDRTDWPRFAQTGPD